MATVQQIEEIASNSYNTMIFMAFAQVYAFHCKHHSLTRSFTDLLFWSISFAQLDLNLKQSKPGRK